jgi:DNA-directed RNA polymerase subunit RPC12/RpoP
MEERSVNVKCPVCSDKLDVDIKLKSVKCHGCGWNKTLNRQN